MPRAALYGSLIAALAAVVAIAAIHPDVRVGLWEWTFTSESSGAPPLPPEVLARMTPEQRAKLEARMNHGPEQEQPRQTCLTQEKLDQGLDSVFTERGCKVTKRANTGNTFDWQAECTRGNGQSSILDFHVETQGRELAKIDSTVTITRGDNTMKKVMHGTGRFVSADCGSVKP